MIIYCASIFAKIQLYSHCVYTEWLNYMHVCLEQDVLNFFVLRPLLQRGFSMRPFVDSLDVHAKFKRPNTNLKNHFCLCRYHTNAHQPRKNLYSNKTTIKRKQ